MLLTQTQVSTVSGLLNSPPCRTWETKDGRIYEWQIPEAYTHHLSVTLRANLVTRGCQLINVDSSRAPFYYVSVRLAIIAAE